MQFALALTTTEKGLVLILIACLAAPIAAFVFARSGGAWRSIGRGPLSIEHEDPSRGRGGPPARVDPAIQAAEVRQMLEAKAERQRQRGERALDVEAETERLLETSARRPTAQARMEDELRAEVRQLVIARNERRRRQGLDPLDVEAETERQLIDLEGSP